MSTLGTTQEYEGFNTTLKDKLCSVYNYILRFQTEKPFINFTRDGVFSAYDSISITAGSNKWANKFVDNLEQVKLLAENQPTYLIEITSHIPTHMGEFYRTDNIVNDSYVSISTSTIKCYDWESFVSRINYEISNRFFHTCRVSCDGKEVPETSFK